MNAETIIKRIDEIKEKKPMEFDFSSLKEKGIHADAIKEKLVTITPSDRQEELRGKIETAIKDKKKFKYSYNSVWGGNPPTAIGKRSKLPSKLAEEPEPEIITESLQKTTPTPHATPLLTGEEKTPPEMAFEWIGRQKRKKLTWEHLKKLYELSKKPSEYIAGGYRTAYDFFQQMGDEYAEDLNLPKAPEPEYTGDWGVFYNGLLMTMEDSPKMAFDFIEEMGRPENIAIMFAPAGITAKAAQYAPFLKKQVTGKAVTKMLKKTPFAGKKATKMVTALEDYVNGNLPEWLKPSVMAKSVKKNWTRLGLLPDKKQYIQLSNDAMSYHLMGLRLANEAGFVLSKDMTLEAQQITHEIMTGGRFADIVMKATTKKKMMKALQKNPELMEWAKKFAVKEAGKPVARPKLPITRPKKIKEEDLAKPLLTLQYARRFIDQHSTELVRLGQEHGLMSPLSASIIMNNKGKYLRRFYAALNDPAMKKKLAQTSAEYPWDEMLGIGENIIPVLTRKGMSGEEIAQFTRHSIEKRMRILKDMKVSKQEMQDVLAPEIDDVLRAHGYSDEGVKAFTQLTFNQKLKFFQKGILPRRFRSSHMREPVGILKRRKLGESPRDIKRRKAFGEQKGVLPIVRTMEDLAQTVGFWKFTGELVKNKKWVSLKPEARDWVKITQNLGALKGKYVHPEIHHQLIEIDDIVSKNTLWRNILSMFKGNKVTLSPKAQFRNNLTNMILLNMDGMPIWDVPRFIKSAAKDVTKGKGKYYRIAHDAGWTGEKTMATNEIMAGMGSPRSAAEELAYEKLTKDYLNPKNAYRLGAKAYSLTEGVGKLAHYKYNTQVRKMSHQTAVMAADKALFDYSNRGTSRAVRFLRTNPVIPYPFFTFTAKIIPKALETMAKNPMAMYKYKIMMDVFNKQSSERLGLSDKFVEQMYKDRGWGVVLPVTYENGDPVYLSLEYLIPWTAMNKLVNIMTGGKSYKERWADYMPEELGVPGGPTVAMAEILTNRELWNWSEIYGAPSMLAAHKMAAHVWKGFWPSWIPYIAQPVVGKKYGETLLGPDVQKMINQFNAADGLSEEMKDWMGTLKGTWKGNSRSAAADLFDVLCGFKTYEADPIMAAQMRIHNVVSDMYKTVDGFTKNAMNKGYRSSQIEKQRDWLYDRIDQFRDIIHTIQDERDAIEIYKNQPSKEQIYKKMKSEQSFEVYKQQYKEYLRLKKLKGVEKLPADAFYEGLVRKYGKDPEEIKKELGF